MINYKKQAEELIFRAKNIKKFTVERDWDTVPKGRFKFDVNHKEGHLAKIFVHAMSQEEAEQMVDDWFKEANDA